MVRVQASIQLDKQMRVYQQKMQYKPITPDEERQATPATIKILLLFAVLNLSVADIKFEFDTAGLYRQKNKKTINEVEDIITRLFNRLRSRLKENSTETIKKYDNIYLCACDKVAEAVLLKGPERSVNIALASCRLMVKYNESIKRFCVPEVLPLYHHVIRRLEELPVKDYHIDGIIENVITKMVA